MAIRSSGQFLKRLRSLMKNSSYVPDQIHAYVIPTSDAHQSEYLSPCDKRRQFISGFTGSAGTAIVTSDEAALWTDGRYFLQAEKELDSSWELMKDGIPSTPTQGEWLSKKLPPNGRVGVDPLLISYTGWKKLSTQLQESGHILIPCPENLIDLVWDERPSPPSSPVVPLPIKYAGRSWQDKVTDVRKAMLKKGAKALVITSLDDVAYLFNLRGSDVNYNPVFFSYSVVTTENI